MSCFNTVHVSVSITNFDCFFCVITRLLAFVELNMPTPRVCSTAEAVFVLVMYPLISVTTLPPT